MTDTFRALCAELTYCWSRTTNPNDFAENAAPIIGRMRAALAQPELEGLTDEELLALMPKSMRDDFSCAAKASSDATGGQVKPGIFRVCLNHSALEYARALIAADRARWGRPKLTSLKEQALQELNKVDMLWDTEEFGKGTLNSLDTIRRALEALPDD